MSELFIDGEWAAGTGPVFASHNPGTGAVVWQGNSASADDVDRAVERYALDDALSMAGVDAECCGIVRMAWSRCSGRTTSPAICRTGISCPR